MYPSKVFILPSVFLVAASVASAALNAPSDVTATTAGPATIAISWIDNESSEESYIVQRDDSGWATIATLPANTTHFYDRALALGATHNYRVQASNSGDASAFVESGSATTLDFKPNIIFFLADDMGYKDIVGLRNEAIDGPTIHETPNLDTFIESQALTITNAYCSGPRCVVARRSIQTGKYDWRPEAVPNNDYYVDHDGNPIGGGLWAGGETAPGSEVGAGVVIPFDNETYGEAMQSAGYRTCFIGKYHLGESATADTPVGYSFGDQPGRGPKDQGYDVSIAAGHAGAPPASYFAVLNQNSGAGGAYTFELPDLDSATYGTSAPVAGEYITDRMTNKAIGFINDAITNHTSDPFHMTLAHYAVHTPMEAQSNADAPDGKGYEYFVSKKASMAAEFADHPAGASGLITDYTTKTRVWQDNSVYAAMMKSYDASFGQLWTYLDTTMDPRNLGKKLSETTIVVVSSDHGGKSTTPIDDNKDLEIDGTSTINPAPTYDAGNNEYKSGTPNDYSAYPTSNYPFRQGKTWVYEGGLKVPMLVYIPGVTTGGAQSNAFVHHADLFSTFVDMAGGTQSSESTDSISFMLSAAEPDAAARDEMHHFFTNANTGTGNPALGAYRKGDYKLLYFMVQRRVELYNLAADPYEQNDLSLTRPDLADEMLHEIYQQALSTGMNMPKPGSNTWTSEQGILVDNGLIGSLPAVPDADPTWVGSGATQVSRTTIDLEWTVNATNATHSIIYRRADPDGETNYREYAYVPVGTTTFRDMNLVPGGTYRYRIESENLGGWATETSNKTLTLLDPGPGSLACVAADDTITTVPGELRSFNPLLNDEGEGALTITAITQPADGLAWLEGNTILFQAPDGFAGGLSMTYTIEDSAAQSDTATVILDLPISNEAEVEVEAFEFADTAGTDLNDLANTGTEGSVWNFNTPDATNGTGLFDVKGDSGTTTRKLPKKGTGNADATQDIYSEPFTGGKWRFEILFDSWNIDAASVGDDFTVQVKQSNESDSIARIDAQITATGVSFRFSGFDGNFRSTTEYPLVNNTPVTIAIIFDFDADTIDYLVDGSVLHSFAFNGTEIGQMVYSKSGGTWATAATTINLDHIKLIRYEPAGSLYDAYSSAYPWNGILDRDADDDPDLDGLSNFLEFAFGMPMEIANGSVPVDVAFDGAQPVVRFTPARDTSELNYEVQFSTDLNDWSSIPPVPVSSDAGVLVEEDLPSGPKAFARVGVSE